MTYKELKRINDNNEKWFKDFLSSKSNRDTKERYKSLYCFTLQEEKEGNYLIVRNNTKNLDYHTSTYRIYCLNDLLELLQRLELGYITNLSLISKYPKIINKVNIKTTFIHKIIQKISVGNLLHIHRVANIKEYIAKLTLLGGNLLLSEDRVYFCQKGPNYYLVSEENMIFPNKFDCNLNVKKIILDNVIFDCDNLCYMFYNNELLQEVIFKNVNIEKVKDLEGLFNNCINLVKVDITGLDTSNVNGFSRLFYNCKSLKELDLSSMNIANGYYFNNMFYNCISLEKLDISTWSNEHIISIMNMFKFCNKLKNIDISNFIKCINESTDKTDWNDQSSIGVNI